MKGLDPVDVYSGRYRHFKGGIYEVIGVAAHTETGYPFVVYAAEEDRHKLWTRPMDSFTSIVRTDDGWVPRFVRLDDSAALAATEPMGVEG